MISAGRPSVILDNDPKGIINQALLILRLNKNLIMPKYMKYYLESPIGYRSITANTNKSAQVNIDSRDAIEKIMIPVPSLEEQKRIVAHLDSLSEKVHQLEEIYTKQLADCDELKQSLLQKAFEGEL